MRTSIVLDILVRLDAFNLEVHEHLDSDVVALFGPTGSGKTTMLETIAGLQHALQGEIRVGSHLLFSSRAGVDVPVWQRHVGYVPQDVALFPHMDVRRNITYGHSPSSALSFNRVVDLLDIEPLFTRPIAVLSGGERQRVAIARALLSSPNILLLDEPLTGFDNAFRQEALKYLIRLRNELDIPMFYVSHDKDEILEIADWVIVIERGQVERAGEPCSTLSEHA